jgi:hypothetical protein
LRRRQPTYLLVCCGADKGRRALPPTPTHTHTGLMTGAAPYYLSDFLAAPCTYYFLLRPFGKCGNPIAALLREAGIAHDSCCRLVVRWGWNTWFAKEGRLPSPT